MGAVNWRRRVVNCAAVIVAPFVVVVATFGNGPLTLGAIVLYGLAGAAGSWWSQERPS